MDAKSVIERARTKAFYKLLVDRLGEDTWAERKAAYERRIRDKESRFDIRLPIEPQLFLPAENDIDWYILACHLAYDFPYSDCAYSSRRVYTFAMAIGAVAEQLRNVPNVDAVLNKMLANKSQPETQIFELLTAALYLKNGYEVSFIPENSITWPDGKKKSPDLLVKLGGNEMYVECKRADKQTKYSLAEEEAWASIWPELSAYLLKAAPWSTVDLTFHDQLAELSAVDVIKAVSLAIHAEGQEIRDGSVSAQIRAIDKLGLKRHYRKYRVRPNCPQQEMLVFGNIDSNEKRSIATVADRVVRPGTNKDILNMFVHGVAKCVGAQWRCDHEASLGRRSRHFKGLVNDAVNQIPPDRPGVVHVLYETRDGIEVEQLRREKNQENLSAYDASQTTVLGALIHAVNYYPLEDDYQTAETVEYFSRVENLFSLFPQQTLMIACDGANEVEDITHWEQDQAAKADWG